MILSSSIELFPNITILAQLAIFLVVMVALNHLVFKPVLRILALRKTKTKGEREKLEALQQKTEKLVQEYEAKIQEAKQEGFKMKEAIRKEGEVQAQKIIHEAKKSSLDELGNIRKEIGEATQNSSKKLEEEAKVFSQSLAEKVLGRKLN